MLVKAQCSGQPIELLGEFGDRPLASLQPHPIGLGIEPAAQPFVGALDHLQWLAQIVCGHAQKNRVKVADALQVKFTFR